MISPFVRRRRLAEELIRLREEHGYSSAKLAVAIDVARQRISRLENGHVAPDLDEIMRILQLFAVDEARWEQIMTIAREAQERGWWEKFSAEMGSRQALYANLEAGASSIREYQMVFQPGLLQLSSYTEARARIDRADSAPGYQPTRALEGRAGRQRMVERPGGPTYTVVIDELAIRRHAVPPDLAASQLDHMAEAGHTRDQLTIRVLPIDVSIRDFAVPRSAFSIYRYPDSGDPEVVAVDTVTDDLVLTRAGDVRRYVDLYNRVEDAALPPADSLDFLAAAAERIRTGSR